MKNSLLFLIRGITGCFLYVEKFDEEVFLPRDFLMKKFSCQEIFRGRNSFNEKFLDQENLFNLNCCTTAVIASVWALSS